MTDLTLQFIAASSEDPYAKKKRAELEALEEAGDELATRELERRANNRAVRKALLDAHERAQMEAQQQRNREVAAAQEPAA